MKLNIKKMTLEDLNLISNILYTEFDDFWTYETLKNEITSETSTYLIAKNDTTIVGFAGFKTILDESELMNIVIHKNYRNCGIGTLLLKQLLIEAHKLNVISMHLEVSQNNVSAIHLYKKLGFKNNGFRAKYYNNQGAILMKLDL